MKATHPGMHEFQVEAMLLKTFRMHGSERPAYGSIVGSGNNATILHYRLNNRKMEDGELLLIDAGCEEVEVDPEVSSFRSLGTADFTLQIRDTLEATISSGAITREAGEIGWRAIQELDARKCFFASVNVVICAGTVS